MKKKSGKRTPLFGETTRLSGEGKRRSKEVQRVSMGEKKRGLTRFTKKFPRSREKPKRSQGLGRERSGGVT